MQNEQQNKVKKSSKLYAVGDMRNGYKVLEKSKRKRILLLADDIRVPSGIGTMSREFVFGTVHRFDWIQIAGAINHPDAGKMADISKDVQTETGVPDAEVKLYPYNGYGDPDLVRNLLMRERIDAILHYTDPRFWDWLYNIEHEIRQLVPMFYYNIWDCPPPPYYNKEAYMSEDLIMNISKQTHALVNTVLDDTNKVDLERGEQYVPGSTALAYVPHGINSEVFKPLKSNTDKLAIQKIKEDIFKEKADDIKFVVFFNNRNIRRKMIGDLILAFQKFVKNLGDGRGDEVALVLHTSPRDENGTDLVRLIADIAPDVNIVLSIDKLQPEDLNKLYNLADVTINIASNEGFGLTTAESLMAGTPIIVNVTGGLQDQCGFQVAKNLNEDDDSWEYLTVNDYNADFASNHTGIFDRHGNWVFPVWPKTRSLQGSVATPYIFDDRADWEDVTEAMMYWYGIDKKTRDEYGLEGREFMLSEDAMLSASKMDELFIKNMELVLNNWQPKKKFKIHKAELDTKIKKTSVIYKQKI